MAVNRAGSEDAPETEYLCKHRKHFVVVKPQMSAKLDQIKNNRFQILMSKKHLAPKEVAASNAAQVSQFMNFSKVNTLINKKTALAMKKKEDKNQPNEALAFLRALNIFPQTAFAPERFVDPSAQTHKAKKRDKLATKLLQGEALAVADSKPATPTSRPEDEALNRALKRVELELTYATLALELINEGEMIDGKYILVQFLGSLQGSQLFRRLIKAEAYVYYSVNMVINRIPDDYFEMILLHKLNRYKEYSTRVDEQICRLSDNRLSVFDAGIDNLFHCNMENNTLNSIIGNIFQRNVGITQQIRGLVFQNDAYIVRYNLRP